MDYQKHYDRLISRARDRVIDGYSEKHHVVPKCLGGSNHKDNIVRLTPEEHYVAHQLLIMINPGHKGLIWAAMAMTNRTEDMPRRNKVYGWLRREFVDVIKKTHTGRKISEETKLKLRQSLRGRVMPPHTAEAKAKISRGNKGKKRSEECCKQLSIARTGRKLGPRKPGWKKDIFSDPEYRKRLSKIIKENSKDPDYRKRQSDNMKRVWKERKEATLI